MSGHSVASRYQAVGVQTCTPGRLVVLLLDGAMRFAGEAARAFEGSDLARAGERVSRAHAILEELTATLDHEVAPELADNLTAVYGFCMRRLLEANIQRSGPMCRDVVDVLRPIREAFAEVESRPA